MPNNYVDELPQQMEDDFLGFLNDLDSRPLYSEKELLQLMGFAAYEFDTAEKFLAKYGVTVLKRRQKLRVIILAKRFDLLQNEKLKVHLAQCFKESENPKDSKYKPTKEDLDSFIDTELGIMAEQIERAESIAKAAGAAHDMYSRQLSWYQTAMKKEIAELAALGQGT
jgi:hypothetical protein